MTTLQYLKREYIWEIALMKSSTDLEDVYLHEKRVKAIKKEMYKLKQRGKK